MMEVQIVSGLLWVYWDLSGLVQMGMEVEGHHYQLFGVMLALAYKEAQKTCEFLQSFAWKVEGNVLGQSQVAGFS